MMDEMHTLAVPLASDTPSSAPGRPDEPEALRRQKRACRGRSAINQRACKWGKYPPRRRSVRVRQSSPRGGLRALRGPGQRPGPQAPPEEEKGRSAHVCLRLWL